MASVNKVIKGTGGFASVATTSRSEFDMTSIDKATELMRLVFVEMFKAPICEMPTTKARAALPATVCGQTARQYEVLGLSSIQFYPARSVVIRFAAAENEQEKKLS